MSTSKRKKSFAKSVGKGVTKGLGKLATGAVKGVVSELASIMTLGLYQSRRRHY